MPDSTTAGGKRDAALLHLFVYGALRTIEAQRANVEDLQTRAGRLVLYIQGKGHAEADDYIVITQPELEAALHDWLAQRGNAPGPFLPHSPIAARNNASPLKAIRTIVKGYYQAAGVVPGKRPKSTHSLRHTAISNAIRHNAPIQKVQSMARHASIDTTMIYYHEADRLENPAEAFISYDDSEVH